MDRRADAETVATSPLAQGAAPRPARITTVTEDEGRFVPGTTLGGRYHIIGLLGRGGMGEVYRATDLLLGQSVALKFLPESASTNPLLLERFRGEVRIARQVSHPGVCRVYDIGEAEGLPFISMEYVDGEDLGTLLQRIGRLPADKAVETARQICAGLAAAVFCIRSIVRKDWATVIVAGLIFPVFEGDVTNAANWIVTFSLYFLLFSAITFVLLRVGLLASIAGVFFINLVNGITLGADWTAWNAPAGIATMMVALGVAGVAFRQSLGGRDLFGDDRTSS